MTATNGVVWGVELYRAVIFPLNSDGSLKATSTDVYEGLEIRGPRVFELTPAEPRIINNPGAGRIQDVIYLPPNDATRAELRVGYNQQTVKAALSGVKQLTIAESTMVMRGTDKQGSEPDVAMFVVQLAKDSNKLSRWHYYMIPRAKAIPVDSPMNENALEDRYLITMAPSSVHIWNTALTTSVEGCLEAAYADGMSEGKFNIVAWLADGSETAFDFPADKPAVDVAKVAIFDWATGTPVTSGITVTETGFSYDDTPGTPPDPDTPNPPDADTLLIAKYEY